MATDTVKQLTKFNGAATSGDNPCQPSRFTETSVNPCKQSV